LLVDKAQEVRKGLGMLEAKQLGDRVGRTVVAATATISNNLLELDFCLFKRTLLSYSVDYKAA